MVSKREVRQIHAARFAKENAAVRDRLIESYRFFKPFVDKDLPLLDIGARDGWMLDYLKRKRFTNIMGIDVYVEAIKHAQWQGLNVVRADMHDLSLFEKEKFGTILMIHTFELCHDAKVVMDGIIRILKPNGILYVEMPIEGHNIKDVDLFRNFAVHSYNFTSIHEIQDAVGTQFELLKHKLTFLRKKRKNLLCAFKKIG